MSQSQLHKDNNYGALLQTVKQKVEESRYRAAMSVNSHLIFLYWQIGSLILSEQARQGWGAKVIDQLAHDLSTAYPEMRGLSNRNLVYMRQMAHEWPLAIIAQQLVAQKKTSTQDKKSITQQAVAQLELSFEIFEKHPIARIPWSHHTVLLDKLDSMENRLFYCHRIVEGGWSRKTLLNQLDRKLHLQKGALPNNFETTLPRPQSELARDTFKDPYFFDFLQLNDEVKEREIENKLTEQITHFLLELGSGFAYMGRQFKLEVGGQEYFLDLLFYHTRLRCYIVIELKIGSFIPEYVGKVQFYLSALDDLVKSEGDQASIGLILCKEANRIVAEYALRDSSKPMGVAAYKLVEALPDNLRDSLPSTDDIEASLSDEKKK